MDNLTLRNISYLRARDPSILAFNRPPLHEIRANLFDDRFSEAATVEEEKSENIRIYLRIKSGYDFEDLYEINENTLVTKIPPGSSFFRHIKEGDTVKKSFTFSKIFKPETTQRDIFNYAVKPKLLDFINGQNSTLLTYGASSSGKTFTVIGTDEEPGVLPRSLEYLFRTLPHESNTLPAKPSQTGTVTLLSDSDYKRERIFCKNLLNTSASAIERTQHVRTYTSMQQRLSSEPVAFLEEYKDVAIGVWVSFAEIYNEQIYDLLQPNPPRGKQRPRLHLGRYNGNVYIKNLTSVNVTSGQEAYQILQHGIHNLNYASTELNKHSSRSHSIFTIKLVQVSQVDGGSYVSSFNFCDLAGSERSKKTHNVGDRLKESNNINSSLLVLGRCIVAVRDSQKNNDNTKLVPYRESKLTQLFQRALAGLEDIAMIVNISPAREMFDETQHTLGFSAIAGEVIIDRKPEPKKKNRFSQLVESNNYDVDEDDDYDVNRLQNLILYLRDELERQKVEYEYNQKINMDYLREGYEKLMKEQEESTSKMVQQAEDRIRSKYEIKMDNMKRKYETMMEEMKKKNQVIEISDDESPSPSHVNDRKEVMRLEQTLKEGVAAYKECEEKYNLLQEEYIRLQDRCRALEYEVEVYKRELLVHNESKSEESDQEDQGEDGTFYLNLL